jgi:hypothetical protein
MKITRYPLIVTRCASAFGVFQSRARSRALVFDSSSSSSSRHNNLPPSVGYPPSAARSGGASSLPDDTNNNGSDDDNDDDDDDRMITNTILSTTNDKVDWDDRIGLQAKWTNEAKGWKVAVEWRQTPLGAGLFAAQAGIRAGTVLRVGKTGRNLLPFRCIGDIKAFCKGGNDDDTAVYRSRLLYVKDYLWTF